MDDVKIQYDEEADVLYISFGQSKHVTGVELTDNVLLRLDAGQATNTPPKAIGLTFISFAHLMDHYQDKPLNIPLANLRHLPEELWQAVLTVTTTPPVSDFLEVGLSLSPRVPPLPKSVAA